MSNIKLKKLKIVLVFTALVTFMLVHWCGSIQIRKNILKITVFYDNTYDHVEDLVAYSFDSINRQLQTNKFQFEYTIHKVEKNGSYKLIKALCNDLLNGRMAIIAIGDSPVLLNLYGIVSVLKIPYLSIKWDSLFDKSSVVSFGNSMLKIINEDLDYDATTGPVNSSLPQFLVQLHHPSNLLMKSTLDLIKHFHWEYVTILYQDFDSFYRIEDLIRFPARPNEKLKFQVKQLGANHKSWIFVLKEIKLSGSSHIIVDVQTKLINKFLEVAEELDMTTSYFHFIFTSLDLAVIDNLPSSNITAFQVYEPNNLEVRALLAEFNLKNMVSRKMLFKYMPSEALFIYDALVLLKNTIDTNNLSEFISPSTAGVSCEKETHWPFGIEFMRLLKSNRFDSVSGHVEFDEQTGFRRNITLSIVDKTRAGVDLVGFWKEYTTNESPIEITRSYAVSKVQELDRLKRHLIVTTKLEAPYSMRRRPVNNETLVGNAQYKGYCIDLLEKISKICGFNYTIKLVDDGFHGSFVDGKWNGLVSEIIEKKADLAVAALTISNVREQVIDFTNPFLNLGISILYKRPAKKAPDYFSFLHPLSLEVWLYMLLAYIVVSLLLFMLARFSPYEWKSNHPCKQENYIVENQWSLLNSFWFTMVNLLRQGTNLSASVSPSIRLISIVWAFFTLLLISSYTANLAAFLTVQRMQSSIQSVEDLSKQTDIKYGPVRSGSTENFFKTSKIATYERMWNFMSNNPSVFVKSTDEGIARVKAGGYAYLLESTTNEYARQRDCELMQVGGLLDTKGYGIGVPTGSVWRDIISNALLQLQEKGDLHELYTKWWQVEDIDPNQKCDAADDKKDSASELNIESVGGVFVIMACGIGLSFFVALLEFVCKAKKTKNEKRRMSTHVRKGFKNTMRNFFKAEFETPFPKPETYRRRYQSVIELAKMADSNSEVLNLSNNNRRNTFQEDVLFYLQPAQPISEANKSEEAGRKLIRTSQSEHFGADNESRRKLPSSSSIDRVSNKKN